MKDINLYYNSNFNIYHFKMLFIKALKLWHELVNEVLSGDFHNPNYTGKTVPICENHLQCVTDLAIFTIKWNY